MFTNEPTVQPATATLELTHSDALISPDGSRPLPRFNRYRLSEAIRHQLRDGGCFKPDNLRGIVQVVEDWGLIVGSTALSLSTWDSLPLIVSVPTYLMTILIIGGRQRGLRVNNHQASHKALARNKALNYCLGAVLGAWPALESFSGYDDTHNSIERGHHPNLGTVRDVDHMSVVRNGLYTPNCDSKTVQRFFLTLPLQTLSYTWFLCQNRVWNSHENNRERAIRLIFIGTIATLMIYFGWGSILVFYWLVPLLTTANWIGLFIQVAEHYPLIEMGHTLDIYVSRNRILSPFWNFFVGVHWEGYHLIHHLFPTMPFWHYKKAHQILMQDELYASLHQETGMNALMRQLKLIQ